MAYLAGFLTARGMCQSDIIEIIKKAHKVAK